MVPTITVSGLSEVKKRALAIAENKIAENAGWDRQALAIELPQLAELLVEEGLDISLTGFQPVEIDHLTTDFEVNSSDPDDGVDAQWLTHGLTTQSGDLWCLGEHRLLCGEARSTSDLSRLLGRGHPAMSFADPPYNVLTSAHGVGT
jgi:hypothetical protein